MNERTASRDLQVVLVAGEREQPAISPVEVALRMRGMTTALVDAGDDATIADALERLADGGLVVLGRGETFTGERVDAVRQLVSARGLPMSRTLTLAVDEGARALETRVLATVQRLAASGPARHSTVPPVHSAFAAHEPGPTPAKARALAPQDPSWAADSAPSHARVPVVRRRWPLVIAAGAGIAAVIVAVALVRSGEREEQVANAPARSEAPPTEAPPSEAPPPPSAPASAVEAIAPTAPVPIPVAIGEAPATPAAMPAVEDAPEVVAALRKRDVRALDLVVISPEAAKAADFTGASAYCDALVIGELDGWRLPEIGELLSIARAKMVRRGSFWSSTKGDAFGDLRLVLVLKRERISPIGVGWNAGRVICVRERA